MNGGYSVSGTEDVASAGALVLFDGEEYNLAGRGRPCLEHDTKVVPNLRDVALLARGIMLPTTKSTLEHNEHVL